MGGIAVYMVGTHVIPCDNANSSLQRYNDHQYGACIKIMQQSSSLNENKARSGNVSYSGRSRMDTFQAGTKGYEQTLSSRLGEGTGEARHDTSDGCPGNYPKAEGHVVLFEQFRREQAQRQQTAKEAETFYRSKGSGGVYVTRAFQRYGNKCCGVCGRGASDGMVMHVDHIKPRSLYPHLAPILPICKSCF